MCKSKEGSLGVKDIRIVQFGFVSKIDKAFRDRKGKYVERDSKVQIRGLEDFDKHT